MARPLVITGTNTNVGKTTLARLLLERAKERGIKLAAMKPFCTGGREDAEALHRLQSAGLTLDEANPFHFEAAVTPLTAARMEKRSVRLADVLGKIRAIEAKGFPLLIEGAGGLLSPLGEGFDLLDVIRAIEAEVLMVARNELGVLSQTLLAIDRVGPHCSVALMGGGDASSATNAAVLRELRPGAAVEEMAWVGDARVLDRLLDGWLNHR